MPGLGPFDRKPPGYRNLNDMDRRYVDQLWGRDDAGRSEARQFVRDQRRYQAERPDVSQTRAEQAAQGGERTVSERRESGEPSPQSEVSQEEVGDTNAAADAIEGGGSYPGVYGLEYPGGYYGGEDRGSTFIDVQLSAERAAEIAEYLRAGDVQAARDAFSDAALVDSTPHPGMESLTITSGFPF